MKEKQAAHDKQSCVVKQKRGDSFHSQPRLSDFDVRHFHAAHPLHEVLPPNPNDRNGWKAVIEPQRGRRYQIGMNGPFVLPVLLLLAAASGCQHPKLPAATASRMAVIELTFTQPNTCRAAFGGKSYVLPDDQQAFVSALESEKSNFENARVDGDYNTVPYKCFGSAVFLAQSAGFKRVGFISQPPATPPNH